MTMTSYAQNREDVLLSRIFPRGLAGFYIDVGANDPVLHSITNHFYESGWHGINVEPMPDAHARLCHHRPRDINLSVGLRARAGEAPFFEFPPETAGYSTFSAEQAERHRQRGLDFTERSVEVRTLADVCEEHAPDEIGFLSIDVEGSEGEVLAGADFTRWRPRVVLVESVEPLSSVATHQEWEGVLTDADYRFAAFDGLNRFYVRAEDESLAEGLATPVNVSDDFVPFELSLPIQELSRKLEIAEQDASTAERQLAAVRAVNEALQYDTDTVTTELGHVRSLYQHLHQQLTALQEQYSELQAHVTEIRAVTWPDGLVIDDVGPTGLKVARNLRGLADRWPGASHTAARALLRVRRVAGRG